MSRIPTIRVKSTNPEHHEGFFLRNADDLRYGEELFMAEEFERLGEHAVRLKIANLSTDDQYRVEAEVWLNLKEPSLPMKIVSVHDSMSNPAANVSNRPHDSMLMSPAKIAEGIIGTIVAGCIFYLIYTHFGLKLN